MSFFGALKSLFSSKPKRDPIDIPIEITVRTRKDDREIYESDEEKYKRELFHQQMNDKQYLAALKEYSNAAEKLNHEWSVLYNLQDYSSKRAERFEIHCAQQIDRYFRIMQRWGHYELPAARTNAFKLLSILYERQGRMDDAANVCLKAIELGYEADGTKGGMRGRLARLIKKGASVEMPDEDEL